MSGWQSNPVDYPAHYAGDGTIECRDALRSMMTDVELPPPVAYWWGCAFKYLWRWPRKGGRQDVEKARRCLDELLWAIFDAENGK